MSIKTRALIYWGGRGKQEEVTRPEESGES